MKKYFKSAGRKIEIDVPEEFEHIAFDADRSVWVYVEKPVRWGDAWCDFGAGLWFVFDAMKINCKPYCDHWSRSHRRLYPVRER